MINQHFGAKELIKIYSKLKCYIINFELVEILQHDLNSPFMMPQTPRC